MYKWLCCKRNNGFLYYEKRSCLFVTFIFSYGCTSNEEHFDDIEKDLDSLLERMDESRSLIDEQKDMMREVSESQRMRDSIANAHDSI